MPTPESIRLQLRRMLESEDFARNQRLSGFLRHVVERDLDGRDPELKESIIAVEVFGRKPDFDPRLDSIVRTEAGRVRSRLADYYAATGSRAAGVLEVPKGGYVPRYRRVGSAEPQTITDFHR